MSVTLVRESDPQSVRNLVNLEWVALLAVARMHGWSPRRARRGAVDDGWATPPPVTLAGAHLAIQQLMAVPELGPGDRLTAEEAAALADAFERALPSVPAENTWLRYAGDPAYPANIPPIEWWSGMRGTAPGADDSALELIAFLRRGDIAIEAGDMEEEFGHGGLGPFIGPFVEPDDSFAVGWRDALATVDLDSYDPAMPSVMTPAEEGRTSNGAPPATAEDGPGHCPEGSDSPDGVIRVTARWEAIGGEHIDLLEPDGRWRRVTIERELAHFDLDETIHVEVSRLVSLGDGRVACVMNGPGEEWTCLISRSFDRLIEEMWEQAHEEESLLVLLYRYDMLTLTGSDSDEE